MRQTILQSKIDAAGKPGFLSPGTGLSADLLSPLRISFAAGFDSSGPVDHYAEITSNQTGYWSSLPASNTSFLALDRNPSTGALSAFHALLPPQVGAIFNKNRQALLHFAGNVTDDYGGTWTNVNGTFENGWWKGNGSSAYLINTNIRTLGYGPWTVEFKWKSPTLYNGLPLFSATDTYGAHLQVVGSGPYYLNWNMSSTGTSWDIGSASGQTGLAANTEYHVEITFDGTTYRLFLNGILEASMASTKRVRSFFTGLALGTHMFGSNPSGFTNALFDEFRFSPCARHVANFTQPSSELVADGDWFDSSELKMKSITGPGPAFSEVQRIYVGQVKTGASSVAAVYPFYARTGFEGEWDRVNLQSELGMFSSPQPEQIVVSSSLVPPDARSFFVQVSFATFRANSEGYIDTGLTVDYYGKLAHLSAHGRSAGQDEEPGGYGEIEIPVENGIAAFTLSPFNSYIERAVLTLMGYRK